MKPAAPVLEWRAAGVEVTLPPDAKTPQVRTQFLTHEEISQLTNYHAREFGLPPLMEAMLVLSIDGRIDMPTFQIQLTIEPFFHFHAWPVYQRKGAIITVGERTMRLNLVQLRVMNALEAMKAAQLDVAKRLRAWATLSDALHISGRHHVLVTNDFPRHRIQHVAQLPVRAMTRIGTELHSVTDYPNAAWAMEPGRRYYISTAAI